MIRSSKHSLKFTNRQKRNELEEFIFKYRHMVRKYINIIWNEYKDPPSFLNNDICKLIRTDIQYDSRIRQCAAKQACSMVSAIVSKHNKRLFKLKQLQKDGKNTKRLQQIIEKTILNKPKLNKINVELDSRFVDFKIGNHFGMFIQIKEIGNKKNIKIPIKLTSISNKWAKAGKLKKSIRLATESLTLFFDINDKPKIGIKKLGADQGQITCLTLSDGQTTTKNNHNYDLNNIQDILTRRKQGSKGFRRAQSHRKNYINWSLNQLNFSGVKEIGYEKIFNLRKGRRTNRKMSHWTYSLIKRKLIKLSEDKGFVLTEQNNKFMSQRCSQCGWTHKSNRKRKTFKCTNTNCNFIADSDLNAASNHEIKLIDLPQTIWQERINRIAGFFWLDDQMLIGQASIVPDVELLN